MKRLVYFYLTFLFLLSCENRTNLNSPTESVQKIKYSDENMEEKATIEISNNLVIYHYSSATIIKDSSISFSFSEWNNLINSFDLNSFFQLHNYYDFPYDSVKEMDIFPASIEVMTNFREKEVSFYLVDSIATIRTFQEKLYFILSKFE